MIYMFNVFLVKNIWTKKNHQNQRHFMKTLLALKLDSKPQVFL